MTALSCSRSSAVTILIELALSAGLKLGLEAPEVDAGGFGSNPHHRAFDDVQDVERRAERACEFAAVEERRFRSVTEICCDEDLGDFDHMTTFTVR